jgi:hypothetical protein
MSDLYMADAHAVIKTYVAWLTGDSNLIDFCRGVPWNSVVQ